jgi:competence protein ComEC
MMAANRIGTVDVVKVAHHGSANQDPRLYARYATVGVIGVGLDNGYGHPTDKLLGILAGVGTLTTAPILKGWRCCRRRTAAWPSGREHPLPEGKALSH